MNDIFQFDLFISYCSVDRDVTMKIIEKIEKRGMNCFYAPRNIRTGEDYAGEIIRGISNSTAILLVYSSSSDKSAYVLREINAAVARNKVIIPLRIESFLQSQSMEFYLGPTHWLDAFPEVLDVHVDSIEKIVRSLSSAFTHADKEEKKDFYIKGIDLLNVQECEKIGYSFKDVTIREIDLDYLCIPDDKYLMNETVEGTVDDWSSCLTEFEEDTSTLLVKEDEIIGYTDVYPLTEEGYETVISGKEIVREDMIAFYSLGGNFHAYIAMIAVDPKEGTAKNYTLLFKWIYQKLLQWKRDGIIIDKLGLSVYGAIVEKFAKGFGFVYKCQNPANGKVYEVVASQFMEKFSKIKI